MSKMKFTRGDTYGFKFQRLDNDGKVITDLPDKMWFTVKDDYESSDVIIQKTLEDGIAFSNNYYHITIESEDTRDLSFGSYVYDIQVMNDTVVQTISKGTISLTYEVTTDYE